MTSITKQIGSPLLTIIKLNKVSFRTMFYDLDGKQVYIENDLFNEMVYVKFIGIETPFLPDLRCNIKKINIHCLSDWIDQIFKVLSFHNQNKHLEVIQKIQDDIKEHVPQFFKQP
jgi:hypothetical protein